MARLLLMALPAATAGGGSGSPCPAMSDLQRAEDLMLCPTPSGGSGSWPSNDPSDCATNNTGSWKVLMTRHAESVANTYDPEFVASCTTSAGLAGCNHSYDPRDSPLSADGMATSSEQGRSKGLASLGPPDVIFISPMLRTMQTAKAVIPEAWLRSDTPPELHLMPLVQECSAPEGSTRGGGTWAQPIWQNWGHPPSSWFNVSCLPELAGASLVYNNTRLTCLGYQGVEDWVTTYVNKSGSGYRGFFRKDLYDLWEEKEVSNWSPDGKTCRRNAAEMWTLINSQFKESKVMIVAHHQFLRTFTSWPEDVDAPDIFIGHAPPSFVCMNGSTGTDAIVSEFLATSPVVGGALAANHGGSLLFPEAPSAAASSAQLVASCVVLTMFVSCLTLAVVHESRRWPRGTEYSSLLAE